MVGLVQRERDTRPRRHVLRRDRRPHGGRQGGGRVENGCGGGLQPEARVHLLLRKDVPGCIVRVSLGPPEDGEAGRRESIRDTRLPGMDIVGPIAPPVPTGELNLSMWT